MKAIGQSSKACAIDLVERSILAIGGRNNIDQVHNIQFKGYGYRNLVEQSERFEGPYIPDNFTFFTLVDVRNGLMLALQKNLLFDAEFKYRVDKEVVALDVKGKFIPWPQDQMVQDDIELGPLWILKTAIESNSASCLPDTIIQGVVNKRIQFTWKKYQVRIHLNSFTLLLTSVDIIKPYNDFFLNTWGDSKKVVYYSFWDLLDNGLHYPMQRDTYVNGMLVEASLVKEVKINVTLQSDTLRIPKEIRQACMSGTFLNERVEKMVSTKEEIVKDVWMIPGYCTTTVVRQQDGLLLIEAPYSSGFTSRIHQIAATLYPGIPIKGTVSTSDAWLHCGGIRSAVNTGTVIALDKNREILEKMTRAKFTSNPDAWQLKKDKRPDFRYVSARTTLGTGPNRVELIPFNTEAGERMMMVYFPEHKILYASDLYQPQNWQKHYTLEVVQAVQRENLDVKKVYAMHAGLVEYSEIVNSISRYLGK